MYLSLPLAKGRQEGFEKYSYTKSPSVPLSERGRKISAQMEIV